MVTSKSLSNDFNFHRVQVDKRFLFPIRLCTDLQTLIQERAEIEKAYAKNLRTWSKKWGELIEKGMQSARCIIFAYTAFGRAQEKEHSKWPTFSSNNFHCSHWSWKLKERVVKRIFMFVSLSFLSFRSWIWNNGSSVEGNINGSRTFIRCAFESEGESVRGWNATNKNMAKRQFPQGKRNDCNILRRITYVSIPFSLAFRQWCILKSARKWKICSKRRKNHGQNI